MRTWRPTPKQEQFLACGAREAMFGGAAGGGKAVPLATRICTPLGWTTMGAVRIGDQVVDADGCPVSVTATHEVLTPEAWELTFDDGESVVACADHQWVTLTRAEEQAQLRLDATWREARKARRTRESQNRGIARALTPGKRGQQGKGLKPHLALANTARERAYKPAPAPRGSTRSTRDIVASLRIGQALRANHAVLNPRPLCLPDALLPVDPFVLGVWLGDGTSANGGITCAIEDRETVDEVARLGYPVTQGAGMRWGTRGLAPQLRQMDLLKNKHIPLAYLRASIEQRVALLQGLCDTDGHATAKGSVEFTTTSRQLRDGMVELLATLGIKPSVREGRATLKGRDISAKWRIQFWTDLPAFRLKRKLSAQKRSGFRGCHDRRYIVGARRVPSEPMRCIEVDSPSRTYLIGARMIVTHNSEALMMGALWGIKHPSYRALLLRRTYPELAKSLIDRSQEPYSGVGGRYSVAEKTWTFPGGAKILFGYLATEKDKYQYASAEFQHIGFDEVTTFLEPMYTFLFSRLRSSHGLPLYMRGATNPGGVGHDWVLKRFAPWLYPPGEPRYKGPYAGGGEKLYFRHDDREDGDAWCARADHGAIGRVFFPSRVSDNPYLVGTDYEKNLDALDPLTRKQLKFGDWMARPQKGDLFNRAMFANKFFEVQPKHVLARVRYWDRAATEKKTADWTAGVRMSLLVDETVLIENVVRGQWDPGDVQGTIEATAMTDPPGTQLVLELDPGPAGKFEYHTYKRTLARFGPGFLPPQGDKITRAKIWSAQAKAGNVQLLVGPWNEEYLQELEGFPLGGHDDQVDATSGGYRALQMLLGAATRGEDGIEAHFL